MTLDGNADPQVNNLLIIDGLFANHKITCFILKRTLRCLWGLTGKIYLFIFICMFNQGQLFMDEHCNKMDCHLNQSVTFFPLKWHVVCQCRKSLRAIFILVPVEIRQELKPHLKQSHTELSPWQSNKSETILSLCLLFSATSSHGSFLLQNSIKTFFNKIFV